MFVFVNDLDASFDVSILNFLSLIAITIRIPLFVSEYPICQVLAIALAWSSMFLPSRVSTMYTAICVSDVELNSDNLDDTLLVI